MTNELSDPDFCRLRLEFLAYAAQLHQTHDHLNDPLAFARAIGVKVTAGTKNLYAVFNGVPILTYDQRENPRRRKFSLWHEIGHHLFRTAGDGFQALLEELFGRNTKLSTDLEEELCNEVAGQFMLPKPVMGAVLAKYGFDPRVAIELSDECDTSLEVALRRLADHFDIDSWVLLVDSDGTVIYSHTRTRYPICRDKRIPANHVLHEVLGYSGLLETKAVMPYPSNNPKAPRRLMRAISHWNRIVCVIADKFPPHHAPTQPSLFNNGSVF